MTFVDTHAHLTWPKFDTDIDAVVQRATAAGIESIITLATTIDECERVLQLADRFPSVYAAVGVHPNEVEDAPIDVTEPLMALAKHPKVVAIGEAGMDYHYLPSRMQRKTDALVNPAVMFPWNYPGQSGDEEADKFDAAYVARQRRILLQQLDLAVRLNKPISIHERDCAADLLDLLAPYSGKVRGVIHCFGGSAEVAKRMLDLGFHLSFTGVLTFKSNKALREVSSQLPMERLMLETDSPFLSPEPYRGRRCEPAMLVETAKVLAAARGMPVEELAEQTTANAKRLFGLP